MALLFQPPLLKEHQRDPEPATTSAMKLILDLHEENSISLRKKLQVWK